MSGQVVDVTGEHLRDLAERWADTAEQQAAGLAHLAFRTVFPTDESLERVSVQEIVALAGREEELRQEARDAFAAAFTDGVRAGITHLVARLIEEGVLPNVQLLWTDEEEER